ncbi:helix-turn-helix transcriptional regulator [Pseudarthrobacter sp. L19]|uniref:helix-turn-helix transcriptional regulator n=1 Tax=Pseudarthrobacter sp. L19 TaxID=3423951 RepID=UPI003D7BBE8D
MQGIFVAPLTAGYFLDSAHTLAPLGFTVDEALAVTIALGMLAASPFGDAVSSAQRKVAAVMEDRNLRETAGLATRIHLLVEGPTAVVPDEFSTALRSGQVLRIAYVDRNTITTSREVEPMGYIGKGRNWYLVAWCRLRNGVRAFRGDLISMAEPTGEKPPQRPLHPEDLGIVHGVLREITPGGEVAKHRHYGVGTSL